jgi:hypothetical protein
MQNHNPTPLECDGALSDLILQAARQALPANPQQLIRLPDCGERNRPLMPLLIGLIDSTKVTAGAINDNAWDGGFAVPKHLAAELIAELRAVMQIIQSSTESL